MILLALQKAVVCPLLGTPEHNSFCPVADLLFVHFSFFAQTIEESGKVHGTEFLKILSSISDFRGKQLKCE